MKWADRVRLTAATILLRLAVGLLAVACGGLGHLHVTAPSSVAVSWVSAWIRRDVAAMCRDTTPARSGGPAACPARMRVVVGDSDTPWTYGRAGAIQIRRVHAGVAVWVTAPDTAIAGHSFDWALLLRRQRGGRWLVVDYHRLGSPAPPDPLDYYYGGAP